jgi:hypothetical protein
VLFSTSLQLKRKQLSNAPVEVGVETINGKMINQLCLVSDRELMLFAGWRFYGQDIEEMLKGRA